MGASQSESGVGVEMEVEEQSPVIILQDTDYWEMKRDRYYLRWVVLYVNST